MTEAAGRGGGRALDLALRATLLVIVLDPGLGWSERVPATAIAGCALLWPRLARHPGSWLALSGWALWRVLPDWTLADNHHWLGLWWCLGLSLTLSGPRADEEAPRVARWLVGLAFAFATLWKGVLSPDFVDGRFFRVSFLLDGRFHAPAQLVAGASPELFERADAAVRALARGILAGEPSVVVLEDTPVLAACARAAALWTLAIEAAIALSFLAPRRARLGGVRDALLLAFCWSTYAVAPVTGFGWLLCALGLAQCEGGRQLTRVAYVATIFAILAFAHVPWVDWLGI